jgi:hypothetical protein
MLEPERHRPPRFEAKRTPTLHPAGGEGSKPAGNERAVGAGPPRLDFARARSRL